MVPWDSNHLPETYEYSLARQQKASVIDKEVRRTQAHVFIDQEECLEQVKRGGWGFDNAFVQWQIPEGMVMGPNTDPWEPPKGSDWARINEVIMEKIHWKLWREEHREQRPNASLEVRVDGQVQAVITPDRGDAVEIPLPASARYVEIQDPVGHVLIATCHLMDPHDLPADGWQRAVRLPDGGRLQFTFSADPAPEAEEAGLRMTVRGQPASSILRAGIECARAWFPPTTPEEKHMSARWAPLRSRWSLGWATGAVMALPLLAMGVVLGAWLSTLQATPPVTMTVGVSQTELLGLREVKDKLEEKLGATIGLQPITPDKLVATLDAMAKTKSMPDLLSVDNDTLGILVQKGLVQDLSPLLHDAALPRDRLFQSLQEQLRIDGRDYFVPFHPNVKLLYYNEDLLNRAGYGQPPTTWDEWEQLARDLASQGLGHVAIQAHPGKAAAVTAFEWVTAMGGDPRTLADAGAREAFKRLWNVAPVLYPASDTIQFDSANHVLITDRVAVVDNWPYSIKEVMGTYGKKNIKVTAGVRVTPEVPSVHVLGGDVLAIPAGISQERKERAIRLIEQLVAKETQLVLAETLFWAPVREDVYAALYARKGMKEEYFRVIREALQSVVMRPMTPHWGHIEQVLSKALQKVLQQSRAQHTLATRAQITDAQIDDLLRPFIQALQAISLDEYKRCDLVTQKTVGNEPCVEGPAGESFAALFHNPEAPPDIAKVASTLNTTSEILAMVNGRDESAPVSPQTMPVLLVPSKKGE
jgi:ABC-type glycerol-3-phosphate transport system substrate-binding protein